MLSEASAEPVTERGSDAAAARTGRVFWIEVYQDLVYEPTGRERGRAMRRSKVAVLAAAAVVAVSFGPAAAQSDPLVREVQVLLIGAGYAPGSDDGLIGDLTRGAIRRYQTDWGLPVDGQPSDALVAHLTRAEPVLAPVTNVDGCQVWLARPRAQASATWDGGCEGGLTAGSGTLTVVYVENGASRSYTYVGERRDGLAHGQGEASWASGARYTGEWSAGALDGEGVFTFPSGARWEGGFAGGRRSGPGTYVAEDDERFDGVVSAGCVTVDGALAFEIPAVEPCALGG